MKLWYLKALLIISVSTVFLRCLDVHTLQVVHAQGSPQPSPPSTTQSSSSASSQSGEALLQALVTTNVTLIIALGSGFTWVFVQYIKNLKEYKEQLKTSKKTEVQQELREQKLKFDTQLANKEVESQQKLNERDTEIRTLKHKIEDLERKNKQHIQNVDFQIREYCSILDNDLEIIGQQIPDTQDKLSNRYGDLVSQSTRLAQDIDHLMKEPKEQDSFYQLSELKDKKYQIDHETARLEEELENLKMILRFIPKLQIYQQIIRDLLVKAAIPQDAQKISNKTILRMLKEGLEEIKKYEEEEQLENSFNDVRKFFSMQGG